MKKIVLVVMMMIAAASYGAVSIDWKASAGFYWDPSLAGILGDGLSGSTVVQLMYSADATQDAGNLLTGIDTNGVGYVENGGDDVIWGTVTLTENGAAGDFDEYAAFSSFEGRAFVSGSVYAMIFQDNVLDVDDWYFYSPMVSVVNVAVGDGNQTIEMNTDLANGNAINSGLTVGQVVPEPATMLLFGIGGLGAWLLRRRQQA